MTSNVKLCGVDAGKEDSPEPIYTLHLVLVSAKDKVTHCPVVCNFVFYLVKPACMHTGTYRRT